jgi:hypothetical protein
MSTRTKVIAFIAGLVVIFAAALGIGKLVGEPSEPEQHGEHDMAAMASADYGLQNTKSGYTLATLASPSAANTPGALTFTITGPDGKPVTTFETAHDKQLHLIVVRSDTAQYRHVHPTMAADGTWSIDWTWPTGGNYRVFADFEPTGGPGGLVLSSAVSVGGTIEQRPLPAPSRTFEVDGYTVSLDGDLTVDGGTLGFTVTRDGQPVTDLQPYLGANGHLVALRVEDLAYLHVHPENASSPGPTVQFHAQAPTAAGYRLFFDFKHGDVVRTAEFTIDAHGEHHP